MNHRDPERGEPDLDDMLRALAHDDAQTRAPATVRDIVMAAWDAQHAASDVRAGLTTSAPTPLFELRRGLAEALRAKTDKATAVRRSFMRRRKAGPYEEVPWHRRWRGQMAAAAAAVIAVTWLVAHFAPGRVPADALDVAAIDGRSYFAPTGDAAMSALVGEPALDTESLQIVRVRMPRGALRAFGVALLDPDVASDVEVDVLVGDDGFPRSIQRVRPMPAAAQERRP